MRVWLQILDLSDSVPVKLALMMHKIVRSNAHFGID